jgi:hypothetical protein
MELAKQEHTNSIPINSVDSILYACFPEKNYTGYATKPLNLQQVVPEHMQILRVAISQAQKSLDDFVFCKE